ncbi:MAG: sulfatase-like hydrolase/transferase [Edaphobacter sp.]|uniref:sulfatase-like hydrolase/transferase n=1 Tax=Edaphobacter sp. TaxID=1934404 RepID=UPI0023A59C6A|nr:sulfatase-like hydrolase/transferase [Edaphobacter sp.]MDE1177918.1 sulfatase-like hydrolase/transferase [Edaphobacter sp.]
MPASSAHAAPAAGSSQQPNFLFIIADDLMFRTINSINNPEVHTPNMDRLVRSGCHFTHCFHQGSWTGAVCVASRTMLNTGLTAFHANREDSANTATNKPVWGQTLREAGYDTYITGKWHLDAVSLQRAFSEMGPVAPGFLPSTAAEYNRPAPGNNWNPSDKTLFGHWLKQGLWTSRRGDDTIQHSSELYADAAIKYLKESVPQQKNPFFMYVGFNAPHDPRQAPQEYLDMYPVEKIAIPPNFLPEHPFDQGAHKTRDEVLAPFPRTEYDVRVHRREYYAIITHMDAQIGRILDALEASGKADNTYVIMTADHGLAVGEHGLMGKQNQYECSMRMPLIIKGPGIKAGKQVDEMVYQHSMYATTCDLAHVPIPQHVEFPSLAPMLHEENPQPINDAMFGWLDGLQRSIRTKKHKLIFYAHLNRYQVFDLEKDPWEMHDLVDEPAYATVKQELIQKLKAKQKELDDPMDIDHPKQVSSAL